MTPSDEVALRRYFRAVTDLSHAASTTGVLLERQEAYYRDSNGDRILPSEDWVYMAVHEDKPSPSDGPSYTPELGGTLGSATVSRRLRELSDIHQAVLASYYGDVGMHWQTVFDGTREIGSVYWLTEEGREFIQSERAKQPERTAVAPHRIIEAVLRVQDGAPHDERGRRIRKMETSARELLSSAKDAYSRTA